MIETLARPVPRSTETVFAFCTNSQFFMPVTIFSTSRILNTFAADWRIQVKTEERSQ